MKKAILLIIMISLYNCNKSNDEVKVIKGLFVNNSLFEYDPLFFDFQEDSLSILYPYRSYVLKSKFILSQNDTLHLFNSEFNVDLKVIKNSNDENFSITGTKNTVSIKDTISLTPVYFKEINVNYKSMNGYWYSKDFYPLKQGKYWLKFEKNRLLLKSEYMEGDIFLQEFDYTINSFGIIRTLNIRFLNSDAILIYDKINDKEIQLLYIRPSENEKYFIHLDRISEAEYKNVQLNEPKEENLPTLKINEPIEEIEEIEENIEIEN